MDIQDDPVADPLQQLRQLWHLQPAVVVIAVHNPGTWNGATWSNAAYMPTNQAFNNYSSTNQLQPNWCGLANADGSALPDGILYGAVAVVDTSAFGSNTGAFLSTSGAVGNTITQLGSSYNNIADMLSSGLTATLATLLESSTISVSSLQQDVVPVGAILANINTQQTPYNPVATVPDRTGGFSLPLRNRFVANGTSSGYQMSFCSIAQAVPYLPMAVGTPAQAFFPVYPTSGSAQADSLSIGGNVYSPIILSGSDFGSTASNYLKYFMPSSPASTGGVVCVDPAHFPTSTTAGFDGSRNAFGSNGYGTAGSTGYQKIYTYGAIVDTTVNSINPSASTTKIYPSDGTTCQSLFTTFSASVTASTGVNVTCPHIGASPGTPQYNTISIVSKTTKQVIGCACSQNDHNGYNVYDSTGLQFDNNGAQTTAILAGLMINGVQTPGCFPASVLSAQSPPITTKDYTGAHPWASSEISTTTSTARRLLASKSLFPVVSTQFTLPAAVPTGNKKTPKASAVPVPSVLIMPQASLFGGAASPPPMPLQPPSPPASPSPPPPPSPSPPPPMPPGTPLSNLVASDTAIKKELDNIDSRSKAVYGFALASLIVIVVLFLWTFGCWCIPAMKYRSMFPNVCDKPMTAPTGTKAPSKYGMKWRQ